MEFKITYMVGKSKRRKTIQAKNLDDAELIANDKFSNWIDIRIIRRTTNGKK